MNRFDKWLSEQSISANPDPDYTSLCGGVSGVPVPEDDFDACMSNWALKELEPAVLSRNGVIQIMTVKFRNKGAYADPYEVLEEQRSMIEGWMTSKMESAPSGVEQGFSSGYVFYWHDTNGSMLNTAYSGAAIALGASAVIILLSSKSFSMMAFSTLTILYILTSVTSMLSAIGWSLGFIEAICFSILIGVSVDFVIHFAHAYTHHKGEKSREERTKYAMITMGPSILATALTTFFSAVVMLFCTIPFFQKFALILFFTVIQVRVIIVMPCVVCYVMSSSQSIVN
jgi:predicted RND superfamily exporter protein